MKFQKKRLLLAGTIFCVANLLYFQNCSGLKTSLNDSSSSSADSAGTTSQRARISRVVSWDSFSGARALSFFGTGVDFPGASNVGTGILPGNFTIRPTPWDFNWAEYPFPGGNPSGGLLTPAGKAAYEAQYRFKIDAPRFLPPTICLPVRITITDSYFARLANAGVVNAQIYATGGKLVNGLPEVVNGVEISEYAPTNDLKFYATQNDCFIESNGESKKIAQFTADKKQVVAFMKLSGTWNPTDRGGYYVIATPATPLSPDEFNYSKLSATPMAIQFLLTNPGCAFEDAYNSMCNLAATGKTTLLGVVLTQDLGAPLTDMALIRGNRKVRLRLYGLQVQPPAPTGGWIITSNMCPYGGVAMDNTCYKLVTEQRAPISADGQFQVTFPGLLNARTLGFTSDYYMIRADLVEDEFIPAAATYKVGTFGLPAASIATYSFVTSKVTDPDTGELVEQYEIKWSPTCGNSAADAAGNKGAVCKSFSSYGGNITQIAVGRTLPSRPTAAPEPADRLTGYDCRVWNTQVDESGKTTVTTSVKTGVQVGTETTPAGLPLMGGVYNSPSPAAVSSTLPPCYQLCKGANDSSGNPTFVQLAQAGMPGIPVGGGNAVQSVPASAVLSSVPGADDSAKQANLNKIPSCPSAQ